MKNLIYAIALVLIVNCSLIIDNCFSQWVLCNNGIPTPSYVRAFAVLGNDLFLADGDTLYKSGNNGSLWTRTSLNKQVNSLAVSGNNIFAGTWADNGVWLSANNGATWSQTALSNGYVSSLFIVGNNIYACNGSGLFLSSNNGISWIQTYQSSVHMFATIGNTLIGQIGINGLYTSTNQGYNWSLLGLSGKSVQSFAVSGNTMYAGTNYNGLWISTNSGINWSQSTFFSTMSTIYSVITSGNQVIATLDSPANVFYSSNLGQSWTSINQGIGSNLIVKLFSTNGYIFAGTAGYGTWRLPMSGFIGIRSISTEIPSAYSLSQNYPNPFNPKTVIRFQLSVDCKNEQRTTNNAQLIIYDIMGREIATLVNEQFAPGTYETTFDGSALSSGTYFYKLTSGSFSQTKRLTLLK